MNHSLETANRPPQLPYRLSAAVFAGYFRAGVLPHRCRHGYSTVMEAGALRIAWQQRWRDYDRNAVQGLSFGAIWLREV